MKQKQAAFQRYGKVCIGLTTCGIPWTEVEEWKKGRRLEGRISVNVQAGEGQKAEGKR